MKIVVVVIVYEMKCWELRSVVDIGSVLFASTEDSMDLLKIQTKFMPIFFKISVTI